MKIGMVTAVYKPVVNGVTHMISLYKQSLEQLGHEVTIFTLGEPDPAGEEPDVVRSPAIPFGDQGYQIGVRYSREARDRMREMDILHCHHLVFGVDLAHRYGRCPIVLTNHTRHDLYTVAYLPLPKQAADALMRQVWPEYASMADVVISPSAAVLEIMRGFGVTQPIKVIPNGVDLARFLQVSERYSKLDLGIPSTATLAVYTGRLSHEKNLITLINQFAVAVDLVPDLHLLVVGHGRALEELQQRAQLLQVADQVHFFGKAAYQDVPKILAAADLYVTASISEVHPLAIIEAMAVGLPIAATRSPGIADTVQHGVSGFLASTPEKGLAAAMVALSTNPKLRQEMGRAARSASMAYDIRLTVADTLQLYETLRKDRPDLSREHKHGRWYRPYKRLRPRLQDIVAKIGLDPRTEPSADLPKKGE